MNERDLFDAITQTPDEMVEEARHANLKKRTTHWRAWVAIAACAAVVATAVFTLSPWLPGSIISGTAAIQPLVKVQYPQGYDMEDYDARSQIYDQNPVDKSFLTAVNDFSYQTAATLLAQSKGNQNYSPLTLYYALAVAATGANGDTAAQFYTLLGVAGSDTLATQCSHLYRLLYTDNNIGQLKMANSVWCNRETTPKTAFAQTAAEQFYASMYTADFSQNSTAKAMGQWIADNTGGLLAPDIELQRDQLLALYNTVYFCDEWTNDFSKDNTKADTFHTAEGKEVTFDFMNAVQSTAFVRGDGFVRARLALKNGGYMEFVLPDEGISPRELIATPERAATVWSGGTEQMGEVRWKLPKLEIASTLHLAKTLQALGLTNAFGESADFSRMVDGTTYISEVQQGTRIRLDEKGVEAAAYTEILYAGSAAPSPNPPDMILDRPFLYGLYTAEDTPLFLGICDDPTAS